MFLSDIRNGSIQNSLGNAFRVHEGEGSKLMLLWTILFTTVAANFVIWSVVQSTFIKRAGVSELPYLYFASSIAILLGSILYARFSMLYRKTTVMHVFNLISAVLIVGSWYFLYQTDVTGSPISLSIYLFLGILGNSAFLSFISSQLLTVVSDVFSTSQAKRLFPLLGISGTVAGMVSGALLEWGTPFIGTTNMLLVGLVFLLSTSPLIAYFQKRYAKELGWFVGQGEGPMEKSALKSMFKYVFSSRFIIALAVIIMLHWFFNRLFGFVFAEMADRAYPLEDAFTQFSGLYLIAGCAGSILFDSIFLNRVLEKLGLTRGMFLVSNIVTVLALSIFAFPVFAVVVGASYIRDILLSIQGNSVEVMTTIIPDEHRAKVSSFLDGTVVTVGGGLGSLLVLLVTKIIPAGSSIETELRAMAICILVLLLARFALNFYLRSEFFRILEDNLVNGDLKTKQRAIETLVEHKYTKRSGIGKLIDTLKDVSEPLSVKESVVKVLGQITDPTTMRILIHQLASKEPVLRLAAAQSLAEFHLSSKQYYEVAFSRHHAIEELRKLFAEEKDSIIRASALDALIHLEDEEVVPFILQLLKTGDTLTRADCVHSLRLFHDPAIVDDVRKLLAEKDPVIRTNAVVALWQFPWEREKLARHVLDLVHARSEAEFSRLSPSMKEEFRLGIKAIGDISLLAEKKLLEDGLTWSASPDIQTECALSLFKMGDPEGSKLVRNVLEDGNLAQITRIRQLSKKRILDPKAGAVLQELIEDTSLEYPTDVPNGERLARPIGMIPRDCLVELEKFYNQGSEHEELGKIHRFLGQKKSHARIVGTVLMLEPDKVLRRMYSIGLLAHGFEVKSVEEDELHGHLSASTAIVYDRGGSTMPDLKLFGKNSSKVVVVLGKGAQEAASDVARVEHLAGVVFRHHFSATELVDEVKKKLS